MDRFFDLQLDHWGFARRGRETYQDMRQRIAPDIALWWQNNHNGFYDNSLNGVADLDRFAGNPSPDIYYFTMSFCADETISSRSRHL